MSEMASAFNFAKATPLHSSSISKNSYEDIRIDENADGAIDFWYLKNSDTIIYITFKGHEISELSIQKFQNSSTTVANFVRQKDKMVLKTGFNRPIEIYNGEPVCVEAGIKAAATELKKTVSLRQQKDAAMAAISCSDEPTKAAISEGLFGLFRSKKLTNCFNDEKLASVMSDSKVDLAFLAEKIKLDINKIENQSPDTAGLIQCTPSKGSKISGTYTENGKISIAIPKSVKEDDIRSQSTSLLFHELIHRAGIKDDAKINTIVKYCESGVLSNKGDGGLNLNKQIVSNSANNSANHATTDIAKETKSAKAQAQSRNIASTAAERGGGGDGVNIAKEVSVAEVKQAIPSADKLAINSVNMTDEGKVQAVAASERQSAPVFAMADRAMGVMNTPALASSDDSSSSRSSTSSGTGDRYQARHERYESKNVADTNNEYDAKKGIYVPNNRNGMKVTEEIDLTQNSATSTGATRTTNAEASAKSRMMASAGKAIPANQDGQPGETAAGANPGVSDSSGASTASGANTGGSGTYYANGSNSKTRKTNAQTRSTASIPSTPLPEQYGSRDLVIDQFSGSSYRQVKNLMRNDSDFKRALETYKIKVVDTNGGVFGSAEGVTVYSDTGSGFLMIKRK